MAIKSYQSVMAADLGTSCFHSVELPAVNPANSIISHVSLRPLACRYSFSCPTGSTPASLSVNTAVCISTPRLLSRSSKSQVKDSAAMGAVLRGSSQIITVLKGHQFGPEKTRLRMSQSDKRQRRFQTAGRGSFSLSGHYRVVINKSTSL